MKRKVKPIETNPYDLLDDDKDKIYVDMAVHGYPYSAIAQKAHVKHGTVAEWFYKKGRLYNAFKWRKKEHRKEFSKAFKEVDKILKDGAIYAALKLVEAAKQGGSYPAQIQAAKEILAQAGFVPTQKLDANVSGQLDTETKESLDKLNAYVQSLDTTISKTDSK